MNVIIRIAESPKIQSAIQAFNENRESYLQALAFVLPNLVNWVGVFLRTRNSRWYKYQIKYWYAPSEILLTPIGTLIYTGIGLASVVIYKRGGGFDGQAKVALYIYTSQLVLDFLWPPILYEVHNIKMAYYETCILLLVAMLCVNRFSKIDRFAAYLTVPYVTWIGIYTSINLSLYRYNPKHGHDPDYMEYDLYRRRRRS